MFDWCDRNNVGYCTGLAKNDRLLAATETLRARLARQFKESRVKQREFAELRLLGDAAKARWRLGWRPRVSFRKLVAEMARENLKAAERDALVSRHGYHAYGGRE